MRYCDRGTPKKGYLQMRQLLATGALPGGVAISDKTASGAIEAIRESGRRIPEDGSTVGIGAIVEPSRSATARRS
ncbi:MAG TPA: hypothetical protein VGL23_00715 [Chloroflexota bacterium]